MEKQVGYAKVQLVDSDYFTLIGIHHDMEDEWDNNNHVTKQDFTK